MIDNLFGIKTNVLVLRFFTKFHDQFFTTDEIVQNIGAGKRNVYKTLDYLISQGVIIRKGKFYKYIVDSKINQLIFSMFEEERKKFFMPMPLYKILSDIESKAIFTFGKNLAEIFVFGSVAKGRSTTNSDIDICILIEKKELKSEEQFKKSIDPKNYPNEIHLHIFTAKEFLDAKSKQNPLVLNIIRDGLSLRLGN